MAEENENAKAAQAAGNAPADDAAKAKKKESGGGMSMRWLIVMVAVVALAGGGGFILSKLVAGGPTQAQAADQAPQDQAAANQSEQGDKGNDYAYVQLEAVTVTLDGPTMARYLQAKVTFAIGKSDENIARVLIEKRMPEIRNWLNVYFASQTLDSVRGDKNLNRMLREIQDALNERLWPDSEPMIHEVLFEGINVQ